MAKKLDRSSTSHHDPLASAAARMHIVRTTAWQRPHRGLLSAPSGRIQFASAPIRAGLPDPLCSCPGTAATAGSLSGSDTETRALSSGCGLSVKAAAIGCRKKSASRTGDLRGGGLWSEVWCCSKPINDPPTKRTLDFIQAQDPQSEWQWSLFKGGEQRLDLIELHGNLEHQVCEFQPQLIRPRIVPHQITHHLGEGFQRQEVEGRSGRAETPGRQCRDEEEICVIGSRRRV